LSIRIDRYETRRLASETTVSIEMTKFVNVVTAAIVALALGAPSIAAAEAGADIKGTSKKVTYADLNLDKEAGAIVLYQRLQIAARQVCGGRTLALKGSLREAAEKNACYQDTLDAAVNRIDNQTVNDLHAG